LIYVSGKILRPDPALVRASAQEWLAVFQKISTPATGATLGDREMEGQMRGLPDLCFQFGYTKADKAEVGSCAAVGYMSQGRYRLRIYRKTDQGWTQHTFNLHLETLQAQGSGRPKGKKQQPPAYVWRTVAKSPADKPRRGRRRH
jgi:hypothetical protein